MLWTACHKHFIAWKWQILVFLCFQMPLNAPIRSAIWHKNHFKQKIQFSKQFLQKHTPEIRSYRVSQKTLFVNPGLIEMWSRSRSHLDWAQIDRKCNTFFGTPCRYCTCQYYFCFSKSPLWISLEYTNQSLELRFSWIMAWNSSGTVKSIPESLCLFVQEQEQVAHLTWKFTFLCGLSCDFA